jgi:hypothetical protein
VIVVLHTGEASAYSRASNDVAHGQQIFSTDLGYPSCVSISVDVGGIASACIPRTSSIATVSKSLVV